MKQHGLSEDGETIVIHRFHGGVETAAPTDDSPVHRFLVVDVESTGLDRDSDRIIEFAAAEIGVQIDHGLVVEHSGTSSWFEDPGRQIPPEIVELTGISDADVAGQSLPEAEIRELFERASVVLAHNARFDRSMCFARFPWLAESGMPPWACSLAQVDWRGHGHRHANLENLAMDHGFFYSGHRASTDIEALIKLLAMRPGEDAQPYFCDLVADTRRAHYLIAAAGSPFEAKDELKQRGYRWDAERKQWFTSATEEELPAEVEWVDALCSRHGRGRAVSAKIPFSHRFDDRYEPIWQKP